MDVLETRKPLAISLWNKISVVTSVYLVFKLWFNWINLSTFWIPLTRQSRSSLRSGVMLSTANELRFRLFGFMTGFLISILFSFWWVYLNSVRSFSERQPCFVMSLDKITIKNTWNGDLEDQCGLQGKILLLRYQIYNCQETKQSYWRWIHNNQLANVTAWSIFNYNTKSRWTEVTASECSLYKWQTCTEINKMQNIKQEYKQIQSKWSLSLSKLVLVSAPMLPPILAHRSLEFCPGSNVQGWIGCSRNTPSVRAAVIRSNVSLSGWRAWKWVC